MYHLSFIVYLIIIVYLNCFWHKVRSKKHVLEFAKILKTQINIPINMEDERLSSVSAEKAFAEFQVQKICYFSESLVYDGILMIP